MLDAIAEAKVVALDKTGTITTGRLQCVEFARRLGSGHSNGAEPSAADVRAWAVVKSLAGRRDPAARLGTASVGARMCPSRACGHFESVPFVRIDGCCRRFRSEHPVSKAIAALAVPPGWAPLNGGAGNPWDTKSVEVDVEDFRVVPGFGVEAEVSVNGEPRRPGKLHANLRCGCSFS